MKHRNGFVRVPLIGYGVSPVWHIFIPSWAPEGELEFPHEGRFSVQYLVQAVDGEALPDGVDWLIVERDDAEPLLIVSGRIADCWRWMRAWEDEQEPNWQPTITLPYRRLREVTRRAG